MKFLLDVNASGILRTLLQEAGYDFSCVGDVNYQMSDDDILTWAVREGRIIITTDSDFEQMIWLAGRTHCGVLRLENLPRSERKVLFQEVLANHSQALSSGAVVIATQQKIRVRRKPQDMGTELKKS